MSSNFLNKSGLSYFYSKIKEMLQNKQDKLYAGDNITIADDGRISASVGGSKNVFFGTCDTNSVNYDKVVTCDDWTWEEGNVLCVHFTNANRATGARLVIGTHEAVTVYLYGNVNRAPYTWTSGEVVQFVYTGGKFYTVSKLRATRTIYGMVRLCDDVDLDSSDYAATSFAVKTAYDLANKKQDKLTAGKGITIENNVISANVEMDLSTYAYDIAEESVGESGYVVSIKPNGMSMEYSGYDAWTLTIKKQRFVATDFTSVNPVVVNLACELDVGNGETYDIVVPCRLKEFFENTMLISCDMFEIGNRCETLNGSTIIQYHTLSNSGGSLSVVERTKLV